MRRRLWVWRVGKGAERRMAVGRQRAWAERTMISLDDIVEEFEQTVDDMFDCARYNTHRMLVQHGAGPDVCDEVMAFLERGLQDALRQELARMRHDLLAAVATRH